MKLKNVLFPSLFLLCISTHPPLFAQKNEIKPVKKTDPRLQVKESLPELLKSDEQAYNKGLNTLTEMGENIVTQKNLIIPFLKKNPNSVTLADGLIKVSGRLQDKGISLITEMLMLKNPHVYKSVVKHFSMLKKDQKMIKALLTGLGISDFETRKDILQLIGNEKIAESRDLLHMIILNEKDVQLKILAADDLGILGLKESSPVLSEAYQHEQAVRSPENWGVRIAILQALAAIGEEEAMPVLINGLSIQDEKERAIKLIVSLREKSIKYLLFALKSNDPEKIDGAIKCLSMIKDISTPYMLELLSSKDPVVKKMALNFFSEVQVPEALPKVIEFFESADRPAKIILIKIFGSYKFTPEINDLLEKAYSTQDDEIKMAVVQALDSMRDRRNIQKFYKIIESDKSPELRVAAINALKHMRAGDDTVNFILKTIEKEVETVIIAAIEALAFLDDKRLSMPYLSAFSSPQIYEKIREKAKTAMKIISYGKGVASACAPKDAQKAINSEIEKKNPAGEESGIKYIVHGKGKQTMFVIPGGPDFGLFSIFPLYDELSDHFRIVYLMPEIRKKTQEGDVVEMEANVMQKIKVKLGSDRIYLLCHDMGIFPCLRFAEKFPDSVRTEILINPPYPSKTAVEEYEKAVLSKLDESLKGALKQLVDEQDKYDSDIFSYYYYKIISPAFAANKENPSVIHCLAGGNVSAREQYISGLSFEGNTEVLQKTANSEIKSRIMIIFTDGSFAPKNQIEQFKKLSPPDPKKQGQMIFSSIPGCGHIPQISCSDKLLDILDDFLEKDIKK
jgi:HEAT repeat protein/pimeloyl-ACP methyl ester carboxylesterase